MSTTRIYVIINPASGQDKPVLAILNRAFQGTDITWEIGVTKAEGDAERLAREAVAEQYDIVAVFGGDGSVMAVAASLVGTDVPLAILPGGTANVMSVELGIPGDLAMAAALMAEEHAIRRIDVGQIGERYFLLRVGLGLEAAMIEGAERELKDRVGVLAYGVSAVQALREPQLSQYHLTLDGQIVEAAGVGCIIANVGSLGQGNLSLLPDIAVDDGLLDVIVLERIDFTSLLTVASSVIRGTPAEQALLHWKAREITVLADPPQPIQVDGEMLPHGQLSIRIHPAALSVIVPLAAIGDGDPVNASPSLRA
ncbi:MAG: diacylglycerol/lipid kinase family protein [Chloroflexota bacterium]